MGDHLQQTCRPGEQSRSAPELAQQPCMPLWHCSGPVLREQGAESVQGPGAGVGGRGEQGPSLVMATPCKQQTRGLVGFSVSRQRIKETSLNTEPLAPDHGTLHLATSPWPGWGEGSPRGGGFLPQKLKTVLTDCRADGLDLRT